MVKRGQMSLGALGVEIPLWVIALAVIAIFASLSYFIYYNGSSILDFVRGAFRFR